MRRGLLVALVACAAIPRDPARAQGVANTSPVAVLAGQSGSIGGTALLAGGCATGTLILAGATTTMALAVTPQLYPGAGIFWSASVTAGSGTAGATVTVNVCAAVAMTPKATTYAVRAIP